MTEEDIARLNVMRAKAEQHGRELREEARKVLAEAEDLARQIWKAKLEVRGIKINDPVVLTVRRRNMADLYINAFLRGVSDYRGPDWAAETATGRMAARKSVDVYGQIVDFHKREDAP
jgi:hypothetical protein